MTHTFSLSLSLSLSLSPSPSLPLPSLPSHPSLVSSTDPLPLFNKEWFQYKTGKGSGYKASPSLHTCSLVSRPHSHWCSMFHRHNKAGNKAFRQGYTYSIFNLTGGSEGSLFSQFSSDAISWVSKEPLTFNSHRWSVTMETFNSIPKLNQFFNVLSTNKDRKGVEFVSSMEGRWRLPGVTFIIGGNGCTS